LVQPALCGDEQVPQRLKPVGVEVQTAVLKHCATQKRGIAIALMVVDLALAGATAMLDRLGYTR
jgi:hypothetical protein